MKHLIKLIRPEHWIKNLLIFAPLVLSFGFLDSSKVILASLGFIAWSMIASAGYIFNDLQDIENDRNHPVKQFRPLASGKVSVRSAIILMLVLLTMGIGIGVFLGKPILAGGLVLVLMTVPRTVLDNMIEKRRRKIRDQLVIASTGLANTTRAGLSLAQSFQSITPDVPMPLGDEFKKIIRKNRKRH